MLKIRSGRYAAIASTAGLVLAMGGVSYAAGMITSAQIADGTIQNRDIARNTVTGSRIHDGSLAARDLAPSARAAAYSTSHDAEIAIPSGAVGDVLSLTVPRAGDYVVNAELEAFYLGTEDSWIQCGFGSGDDVTYQGASLVAPSGVAGIPMQIVHRFAAGDTAFIRCDAGTDGVTVKNVKMTAVSVGTLTNTAG